MKFAADVNRVTRSIAGISFLMAAPYAAGHPLTEGEANQLNQVLAENVLNNLRKKINEGVTEGEGENAVTREYTEEEVQALVDQYLDEYEMGVRRQGEAKVVVDPVEREARKIAREKAKELIKSQGGKPGDYDLEPIIDHIFEQNRDFLLAEGKKIVKANEAAKAKAKEIGGGLDLAAFAKPAAEAAAA